MSFPNFYFVGGEDSEFVATKPQATISTDTNYFRSTFARCALMCSSLTSRAQWQAWNSFSSPLTSFWISMRVATPAPPYEGTTDDFFRLSDGTVDRLIFAPNGSGGWGVYKVTASGGSTFLGTAPNSFFNPTTGAPDKIDIHVVYSTTGSIDMYRNGSTTAFASYTGDITTDGATTLNGVTVGSPAHDSTLPVGWSEIMVSDSDTRSMSLQTLPPVANGNTHNFDIGSPQAAHVNKVTIDDSTMDGASTAGLIDQYTIGSLPAGSYDVAAFGISARAMRGFAGPTKMDLGVRSGAVDYWSADRSLTFNFVSGYQTIWNTDPSTSAAWAALPANIGLKAVT